LLFKQKRSSLDSRKEKKKKRSPRKLIAWVIGDLTIAIILILLLLHTPAGYKPAQVDVSEDAPEQVHRYLTYLGSELYNGAQTREAFDLVVLEPGINQAIAQSNWPKQSEGISFSRPTATFSPEGITLMGTANIEGVDLVVTLAGQPSLIGDGQLKLHLSAVRVGAMNVTPMARIIARKMYRDQREYLTLDPEDLQARIAAGLIDDQPFDPVFSIEGRSVRLTDLSLEEDRMTLRFMPLGRRSR
jgi:hypothetical protein